ncbi:hypothetical protein C8R43DRAFT_1240605 [Mycena crocata]|nr:hypothetical protein C8R43DRAFT_1240605 [Mycena crocata]
MPGATSSAYACGCLNVRITVGGGAAPQLPPDLPASTPDFRQVYVADEGVSVAHPQVTLRIRTRGDLTSRHRRARYTSLTCLVCQVLVYRVHQIVSLDADARDGPLMPTEDWVEQDILKSSSGWIEVHNQCLNEDAITRAEASPQFSALFSLAIPIAASPPTSPQPSIEDGPQVSYLTHLPPLFLPPPFTPAHPVFIHLAALAQAESDAQRAIVERHMAEVMRAKSAELAHTESRLKRQVETVWRKFREGLQSVDQPDVNSLASPRSPRSPRSPTARVTSGNVGIPGSPTIAGTPVAVVRDFVPLQVAPTRQSRPAAISSLSASLATSGFHHPRAQTQEPTSPVRPESTLSSSSRTLSGSSLTLAGSPRMQATGTAPVRIFEEGPSVLQFGRKIDDDINTAASYQFFQNLEADMARSKREQQLRESEKQAPPPVASSSAAPLRDAEASRAGPSTVNGKGKKNGVERADENAEQVEDRSGSSVRDKGKGKQRKVVTFQSQPAVVTIKREVNSEKEEEARLARDDGEEMMFELETDVKERDMAEGAVMMLHEHPIRPRPMASQPRRGTRKAPTDSTGLPQSFSGLRPASLPVPSNIVRHRRPPSPPANDANPAPIQEDEDDDDDEEEEEQYDSRDVEILKLVAADTPSHRGAWKKGGAAWKTLVSRDGRPSNSDDEDDGAFTPRSPPHLNGSRQAGMPGSMPIAIRPLAAKAPNLSLASYRPQTMPPAPQEPKPEAPTPISSSSVRKAVYAERDLERSIDPGALDFATDNDAVIEEEDEEDENNQGATSSAPDGGKVRSGRNRALKILQARNELPDSGMWRSLAS